MGNNAKLLKRKFGFQVRELEVDKRVLKLDGAILLRNKCIIAFVMGIPILAMDSAVVYVLIRIILFHCNVFQESYNSLKMAQGKSKIAPAVLCMAVYL